MKPRLSIIIPAADTPGVDGPAANNAQRLEETLLSVLENRPARCEILVVHSGCYDDPYDLAGEVRFIETSSDAGPIECANAALSVSRSEVVHLLRCGMRVENGWTEPAVRHFDDPLIAAVSPLVLDAADPNRVLAAGVGYFSGGARRVCGRGHLREKVERCSRHIIGPTLAAGFYRTSALQAVGGFSPEVGARLADVDVALSLRTVGWQCAFEPQACVRGLRYVNAWQSAFAHGRFAERLFWRHFGVRPGIRSLLAHSVTVAAGSFAELLRLAPLGHLLGRTAALAGMFGLIGHRRRLRRIDPSQGVAETSSRESTLPIDSARSRRQSERRRGARAA